MTPPKLRSGLTAMVILTGMLLACKEQVQESRIVVSIDSNLQVGNQIDAVRIEAFDAQGQQRSDSQSIPLTPGSAPGNSSFPLMFYTERTALEQFLLVVSGLKSGNVVIESRVLVRYKEHATLFLPILLSDACYEKSCSTAGMTCYPIATSEVAAGSCGGVPEPRLTDMDPRDSEGLWRFAPPPLDPDAGTDSGDQVDTGNPETEGGVSLLPDAGVADGSDEEAGGPACPKGFALKDDRCVAVLDGLSVPWVKLEPAFHPLVNRFEVDAGLWRESIELELEAASGHTLQINGEDVQSGQPLSRSLEIGENRFVVSVASGGTSTTYELVVARREAEEHRVKPREPKSLMWFGGFPATGLTSADFGALYGTPTSLSADGNTLAVGAFGESNQAGAVYVFVREGQSWIEAVRLISPYAHEGGDFFGNSLALSADGRTLVVGAPGEDSCSDDPSNNDCDRAGAVYIFRRTQDVWQQTFYAKTLFNDQPLASDGDLFGSTLALSSDGRILAVGSHASGQVWLFKQAGGLLEYQTSLGSGYTGVPQERNGERNGFGFSIALSEDGATLAVGAPWASGFSGKTYVFTQVAGSWGLPEVIEPSRNGGSQFGFSVALSASGETLAALDLGSQSVRMFERRGIEWVEGAALGPRDRSSWTLFGRAMAFGENDSILAVGAPYENETSGSVYFFTRSSSGWEAPEIHQGTEPEQQLGSAISFSQDGRVLAVSGPGDANCNGGVNREEPVRQCPGAGVVYIIE